MIQAPLQLHALAERLILRGLERSRLGEVMVLKPGKTFDDLLKAWETPIKGKVIGTSHETLVALRAERLFESGIIEKSLVVGK